MSATVRELTLPMALELAANLDARDREEIMRTYQDLDRWALDRCTLPGMAWALIDDGEVVFACGVVSSGSKGTMWIAGRAGWRRHIKHVLRIWREIRAAGVYGHFECQCAEDNPIAQRFAERIGFERVGARHGLVDYRAAA
jgi:hypothetical protein